jgi:putative hydrolase of the HAD superfamily
MLIPGAGEMVCEPRRRGYRLALVADERWGTYTNLLGQHGLLACFDAFAVSECVGVEKPDPHIFAHALGMISVWLDWALRWAKLPADESELPAHTIRQPLKLLALVERLERTLSEQPLPDAAG